ncbi:MAG: sulfotransferase domain-containing protein [Thermodesulfobacteriota bacterium]|nr:sulfotransferase domain-containing protein [Thermodesulfobacteriota bacterium]
MRNENIKLLGSNDVIIANYPGSGSSWFSSLFISLGIFYVTGYDEILLDTHSQKTKLVDNSRRYHVPILKNRDIINPSYREKIRIINTHEMPRKFHNSMTRKVILIVRDGRDSILSTYNYKKNFENLGKISFLEYLKGNNGSWPEPAMGWAYYNFSWLNTLNKERLHVIQFENCRKQTHKEITAMLTFLGIERTYQEIDYAVNKSSYENMRKLEQESLKKEGKNTETQKFMRKGKLGGWRDIYTEEMLQTFSGLPDKALRKFGYEAISRCKL